MKIGSEDNPARDTARRARLRASPSANGRHADSIKSILEVVQAFPLSPSAFQASLQTSNVQTL